MEQIIDGAKTPPEEKEFIEILDKDYADAKIEERKSW